MNKQMHRGLKNLGCYLKRICRCSLLDKFVNEVTQHLNEIQIAIKTTLISMYTSGKWVQLYIWGKEQIATDHKAKS